MQHAERDAATAKDHMGSLQAVTSAHRLLEVPPVLENAVGWAHAAAAICVPCKITTLVTALARSLNAGMEATERAKGRNAPGGGAS